MASFQRGDLVEVFSRMPYGQDNGRERLDELGDRWVFCPMAVMGANRPRIGFTERWLPATVVEAPQSKPDQFGMQRQQVHFRWDIRLWFDWASGERLDADDPDAMLDEAPAGRVRHRRAGWYLPPEPPSLRPPALPCGSELQVGGVKVTVSFIVFRWGAAKIPIQYDSHSWGRAEGSTVSAKFQQLFFNRTVVPRLGWDYEVLTVFIQHSDEFAGISPGFLASLCNGRTIVSLYFLWPIQGQQSYGDKVTATAAYVDCGPFFDLVGRMEACGVPTRWPHHSQLWRSLTSKDWVPSLCTMPKYHVPLTTRVPKSLILVNPDSAAEHALAALQRLQAERRAEATADGYRYPSGSDWAPEDEPACVVKLGYSYEGIDVRMVDGAGQLADALQKFGSQPCYSNDCVYVQQRVRRLDLEARCFVLHGEVVGALYTRFARIDGSGYVRDYQKASSEDDAMRQWFYNDRQAWQDAMRQIKALTRRWYTWMLSQAAEPTVSVRIDYMLERVEQGRADVWTGEVGEQGYSMGGLDPVVVFDAVLDTISPEVRRSKRDPKIAAAFGDDSEDAGRGGGASEAPLVPPQWPRRELSFERASSDSGGE